MVIVDKTGNGCDYFRIPYVSRIIICTFQKNKDLNVKEKEEGTKSAKE